MKRLLVVLGLAAMAAAIDYVRPARVDLRAFDPHVVARLETDMWRSYYDRRKFALFMDLATLLRTQYGATPAQAYVAAFHAGRAAFTFKDGKSRPDYERALPDLRRYYELILAPGLPIDRIAALELEWWIIHRERDKRGKPALDRSLAELQAAVYGVAPDRLAPHASVRAEAMLLRDKLAERGDVSDADWVRIRELLDSSWRALSAEVRR